MDARPKRKWFQINLSSAIVLMFLAAIGLGIYVRWHTEQERIAARRARYVEYQVKGGYLYTFTKFVEWPAKAIPAPDAPIVIGLLDDGLIGSEFDDAMKDQTSHGREIKIRCYKRIEDVTGCHVLFIQSALVTGNLPQILKQLENSNTLTVGEGDEFAKAGGVIAFVFINGKVRFVINETAEQRSGLKIATQLKRVASGVVLE